MVSFPQLYTSNTVTEWFLSCGYTCLVQKCQHWLLGYFCVKNRKEEVRVLRSLFTFIFFLVWTVAGLFNPILANPLAPAHGKPTHGKQNLPWKYLDISNLQSTQGNKEIYLGCGRILLESFSFCRKFLVGKHPSPIMEWDCSTRLHQICDRGLGRN